MKKSMESGASASFLDLLCCALGGVLLLLLIFSARIKPGLETESSEFLIVEVAYRLPPNHPDPSDSDWSDLTKCSAKVSANRIVDLAFKSVLDEENRDLFLPRWMTSIENVSDVKTASVFLVMSEVRAEFTIKIDAVTYKGKIKPHVTFRTKRKHHHDATDEFRMEVSQ